MSHSYGDPFRKNPYLASISILYVTRKLSNLPFYLWNQLPPKVKIGIICDYANLEGREEIFKLKKI